MATQSVTVVRLYVREGEHQLEKIMNLLHDDVQVLGATVFRGIAGFGPDGIIRTASLVDLSLDLPLIIEFYGSPSSMETVIGELTRQLHLLHVVSWNATSHVPDV
jgi:PII-like signaling protein